MIIRDYQDFREVADCNCPCIIQGCDLHEIYLFCDLVRADGQIRGYVKDGDTENAYARTKTTWSDNPNANPPATGHTSTRTFNTLLTVSVEGIQITDPVEETIEEGGGDSFKQPATTTYENPLTYDNGTDQIIAIMNENIDYESQDKAIHQNVSLQGNNVLCQAFRDGVDSVPVNSKSISQQAARIRIGWRPEPPPIDPEEPPPEGELLGEVAIKPYFKLTCDVYVMSENYRQYLSEIKSYDFFKDRHDRWLECEQSFPGGCGPEPIVPDKPTEPTPSPEFVRHIEWQSINGQPAFSDALELPIIDLAPYGEERNNQNNVYAINNIQSICFRDSRVGNVPTSFPTIEDFPITDIIHD